MFALTVFYLPVGCGGGGSKSSPSPYEKDGDPIPPANVPTDTRIPILWLEAGVCTGCSCSMIDWQGPDPVPSEQLVPALRIEFAETIMAEFGANAIDHLLATAKTSAGQYILIVDGAVPIDSSAGAYSALTTTGVDSTNTNWTVAAMIAGLAASAKQVVAVGACASFGGIPGSAPNTGIEVSLADAIAAAGVKLSVPLIRIPGCPPNPKWTVDAIAALTTPGADAPDLDYLGRPAAHFSNAVHDSTCPRRPSYDASVFAAYPGDNAINATTNAPPCLLSVGCKGINTFADCPQVLWQGVSTCLLVGSPCIGCAAPGFLDARTTVTGTAIALEGTAATPFYVKPTS
jgi:hydrogenase small subunit